MTQDSLFRRLKPVAQRGQRLRLRIALSLVWSLAAAAGAALWALGPRDPRQVSWLLAVLGGAVLLATLTCWWRTRRPGDPRGLARQIERRFPELGTSLLAAVEQEPRLPG